MGFTLKRLEDWFLIIDVAREKRGGIVYLLFSSKSVHWPDMDVAYCELFHVRYSRELSFSLLVIQREYRTSEKRHKIWLHDQPEPHPDPKPLNMIKRLSTTCIMHDMYERFIEQISLNESWF